MARATSSSACEAREKENGERWGKSAHRELKVDSELNKRTDRTEGTKKVGQNKNREGKQKPEESQREQKGDMRRR